VYLEMDAPPIVERRKTNYAMLWGESAFSRLAFLFVWLLVIKYKKDASYNFLGLAMWNMNIRSLECDSLSRLERRYLISLFDLHSLVV